MEKPLDMQQTEVIQTAEALKVSVKKYQSFTPFSKALSHSWKGISAKKLKKISPVLFATLGEYYRAANFLRLNFVLCQSYGNINQGIMLACLEIPQLLQS